MSAKHEIEYRVKQHAESKPLTSLERSRKLKSLQVTESKLRSWNASNKKSIGLARADLRSGEQQLAVIRAQKKELEKIKEPIVTEHALLRFIERFMDVDLNEVHKQVLLLTDKEVVRSGNTIVTVFTGPDDHFNLAERETE